MTSVPQYSLPKILAIWVAATVPMAICGWVLPPMVGDSWGMEEGLARAILLTFGLIWMTVLSLGIVRQEEGNLTWPTVKQRLRLNAPRDPQTGETRRKLWWWLVPIAGLFALEALLLSRALFNPLLDGPLSFLAQPEKYDLEALIDDDARLAVLEGAWWLLAIFVPLLVFNILGEELLFRGVLLPQMSGTFGKLAWLANGTMHAAWHVHQPASIIPIIFISSVAFALPAARFRSTSLAMVVHGAQVPVIILLVVGIIFGAV